MVTFHYQQGRMTTISRVILDEEVAQGEGLSTLEASRFSIKNQTFFRFDEPSSAHISVARQTIDRGWSAGMLPAETLNPQAIFFDMDGTVIEEESLVEIAKILKKEQEIEELTTRAMTGEMDFKTSLQARLRILKGLTRQQVAAIKPTLCAGVLELAKWCHQQHIQIFLISGGFQEMAEPIAKQLGCSDFLANRFAWDDDVMQGTTEGDIIDAKGKQQAVLNWIKSWDFQKARTLVVGDGANDLLMMKSTGLAVGFRPKQILWPELKIANHTGDHRFLLESLRQPNAASKKKDTNHSQIK